MHVCTTCCKHCSSYSDVLTRPRHECCHISRNMKEAHIVPASHQDELNYDTNPCSNRLGQFWSLYNLYGMPNYTISLTQGLNQCNITQGGCISYCRNVQILETPWGVYILACLLWNSVRVLCNLNVLIWAKGQWSTKIPEHMWVETKFWWQWSAMQALREQVVACTVIDCRPKGCAAEVEEKPWENNGWKSGCIFVRCQ